MDPIQVEAMLRNTFLATLGSDASLYEGTKQSFIMRFNNESRNLATGMIAQASQRGSALTQADYQSVALDLVNRYKQTMPQQQQYAAPVQQPMYPQQYAAPVMQQPIMQPVYGMPMQPMCRPAPFTNVQYQHPQQYAAPVMQQPVYAPMQPTMTQPMTGGRPLYGGALPNNVQPAPNHPMTAPVVQSPPMNAVPTVAPAAQPQKQQEPQVVQPTYATYSVPQITKRHMFSDKTPQPIKGDIITYQKSNGELVNTVIASTTAMLPDVDAVVRSLAKKKNAIDVTLRYTPYELVAGDLADMQQSFIEVKKIISDHRKTDVNPSDIVSAIVGYCDTKTKGVAKHIENTILDIYNSYVTVANNSGENSAIVPDADQLECLQNPGTASAEKYINMALTEFEQYSIYDPASSQVAAWLKEIDIMSDLSYTDLKKNKTAYTEWAKSHCIIKKPTELYRFTTAEHETTDVTQRFGYVNATPPDDALEFFTMEAIGKEPARVVTMVVQDGKSFVDSKGIIDRSNGTVHVEFE